MKPKRTDVQEMVNALFTLIDGLERARRKKPDAAALSLLQKIGGRNKLHPSEIAGELDLHQSTITRHVQSLADKGLVVLKADPGDGRSCTIELTDSGQNELHRLQQISIDRFSKFVSVWEAEEVRTFTRLLTKLEETKAEVGRQEQSQSRKHWQTTLKKP